MDKSFYSMDISSGWILLTVLFAVGLSFLLYSKKNVPWNKNLNILLGFFRSLALLLLGILFINPTLRFSTNDVESPTILITHDNSSSIKMRMDALLLKEVETQLLGIQNQLKEDYKVAVYDLSGPVGDSVTFDHPSSNLSYPFKKIENQYEGMNIGAILFISDGVYNEGLSPEFLNFRYPIYTVGMGDTIPPKDLLISAVKSNQVAYQGNIFPVYIEISQHGFNHQKANISISQAGKQLASKTIDLTGPVTSVHFDIPAETPGLKHLNINIKSLEGESTTENNHKDIFIEVIEGKESILIIAPSPHPDIHAIRDVLQETGNYESQVYIPGITEKPKEKEYDVIIEHQAFKNPLVHEYTSNGTWYILGTDSKIKEINGKIPYLNIRQRSNQKDLIKPVINEEFKKFELKEEYKNHASNYPPIEVFFGEYNLSGPADVLLYQKVGAVVTGRPLMVLYDDGSAKSAVTLGNGIWQWKLQEAALDDQPVLFNEIVLKTIQFLSIRTNKKRFRVAPRQNVYNEGDRIFLESQVYNEIFERTYGNRISLTIKNETGENRNYELIDSPINSAFNIGSLPQGIYTFTASVDLGSEVLTDKGEFLVQSLQIEALDLTANHHLLRTIASKSNGQFYHFRELDQFEADLKNADFKDIIRTRESFFPLIKSLWLIFIILGLLFTEWFLRKYLGMY